jgi:hypothetical protein
MESGEVKKYYRWISGFRKGVSECYLCETEDTVFFESGNSVIKSQFDVDLRQITEEDYVNSSSSAKAAEDQFRMYEELLGNVQPTPVLGNPIPVEIPQPSPVVEKSPVQIILDKQKKIDTKSISISIDFNLPTEKVIDLLIVMFDEDEVIEELIQYAIKDLDVNSIKSTIEDRIRKEIADAANKGE